MIHSLPNSETKCQQSINGFWSCMSGTWSEPWPFQCILKVLAAFIDHKESDTHSAWSGKWASMDHQQALSLHHGYANSNVAIDGYIESCDQVYRQQAQDHWVAAWKMKWIVIIWEAVVGTLVLATGPNSQFGSRSGSDPEPNRCNRFPHKAPLLKVNISCFN
jgi:hypothetical protein